MLLFAHRNIAAKRIRDMWLLGWLLLVGLSVHHPSANAEADGPDFYRVSGVAAVSKIDEGR